MLLKGFILGFSIAAPVGPIGLLCIQRTLQRGRLHGFVSGLGAATADALYGSIAAFGLTTVITLLISARLWLQLGGAAFLLWLGLKTLLTRTPSPTTAASDQQSGLAHAFTTVLLLTLANPATILSFFAVFAGLDIDVSQGGRASALLLVAGVFAGSATWWLTLSFLAGLLRRYLAAGRMRLLNVVAGLSLIALALWSLWPLVLK